MSNRIHMRVLPWASAAGGAVLIAGTLAGQAGTSSAAGFASENDASGALATPRATESAARTSAAAAEGLVVPTPQSFRVSPAITGSNASGPSVSGRPNAPRTAMGAEGAARSGFNFDHASYILNMRSGGIETLAKIPAETHQDVGYSEISLTHDVGESLGRCESVGGIYWAGQYVEEGVLGMGAAPPDAGSVQGGYRNYTISRDVKPDISAGENLTNRSPHLENPATGDKITDIPSDGNPVRVQGKCDNDAKGTATGSVADFGGLGLVGSTSQAEVNKNTGLFIGTGRSYVSGLPGAVFDTVSSVMQVSASPNGVPKVTYRLSLFDSSDGKNGFTQNGFTISGTNVPADQLVKQFNSQAKTFAAALAAVGPFGFSLLAPEVGKVGSTEAGTTNLSFITAPAIQGRAGANAREGTVGQDNYARFGSVTFTGFNEQG